jgi:hypothetical protein
MDLAKMTGHWLGEAKASERPFKPLVESSSLSALNVTLPNSMPIGMLLLLINPAKYMLPIGKTVFEKFNRNPETQFAYRSWYYGEILKVWKAFLPLFSVFLHHPLPSRSMRRILRAPVGCSSGGRAL